MKFWILTTITLTIVAAIMGTIAYLARDVPDRNPPKEGKTRLNPEVIRLLAYALMILICLVAAMYELSLFYGPGDEQ